MKKFLAMALAAVMVLALAACGSKNDTADDTGDAQDAQGARLTVLWGELRLRALKAGERAYREASLGGASVAFRQNGWEIAFDSQITLQKGDVLALRA